MAMLNPLEEFRRAKLDTMNQQDIAALSERFQKNVVVQDRKRWFTTYPKCFVGSQAVDYLLASERLNNRTEALALGQKLMDEGLFKHVSEDENFEDSGFFYRFNTPEVAAKQRAERAAFNKCGWLERKKGSAIVWCEISGNILKLYSRPGGEVRGKINVIGCVVSAVPNNVKGFQVKPVSGSAETFSAENEKERNGWVSVLCRAKDKALGERDALLELWKKEPECESCIAIFLQEAQEAEKEKAIQIKEDSASTPSSAPETTSSSSATTTSAPTTQPEPSQADALSALLVLPVADVDGNMIKFAEVFDRCGGGDMILLAMLRHFGWKSAAELASLEPELTSLGIPIAAVGSGTPAMAKAFQEEHKFGGQLFCDQKRGIYQALDCNRGVSYLLAPKALSAYKKGLQEGFSNGRAQGDGLQLGGTFLLSRSQGIIWQHVEQFAGDHPTPAELMSAARDAAGKK